jgi:hypothetical protein
MSLKNDMQDVQERTRTLEAQLGKITGSQTLILARFAGKAEPPGERPQDDESQR